MFRGKGEQRKFEKPEEEKALDRRKMGGTEFAVGFCYYLYSCSFCHQFLVNYQRVTKLVLCFVSDLKSFLPIFKHLFISLL